MYSDWVGPALIGAGLLGIWLLGLSVLIWRQNNFLKSLFPKNGERDIRRKFEELLSQVADFKESLAELKADLSDVKGIGLKHVQRVKLTRYNPYDDTGGDQSFTLALLDDIGDGLVLSSLHARSGTRVFAKPVKEGKGITYRLSQEEEKAVEGAMSRK